MRVIIGILVTLGLIIFIIVLLARGGSGPAAKSVNLPDYTFSGGDAQLIIDGPIIYDTNHREVQIDVDQNNVTLTIYQGYQGSVLKRQQYPNTQPAYAVFLHALQHEGFTSGNDGAPSDERGYCPTGDRFIYTFLNNGNQVSRHWSTSCGGQGNFKGIGGTIRSLFEDQVPDFTQQISGDANINFL